MIKVYFDWNVIAQIKHGFHHDLKEIVIDNEKLFIPYSTSHIGDIFTSFKDNTEQIGLINDDLNFISKLTNDKFIYNSGKETIVEFVHPKTYFNQKIEEKDLLSDISIDGLFKNFEESEFKDITNTYLNVFKNIPLNDIFVESFNNPQNAQQIDILFPGLKENPTMGGFFKGFSEMLKGLNEDEKYKDLRKIVQSGLGINRDRIFDSKEPYSIIDKEYQKNNINIKDYIDNSKNAPEWFNEISNEYILLDMHGYQEDNINTQKGRKETFKNTTEDAFHAAFASTCNFYIINDKKSYKKVKQVYEKLEINTLVLKPEDFVEYYRNYIDFKELSFNISLLLHILKTGEYIEQQLDGATLRTYFFPFFIFGFFTKMMLLLPQNHESHTLLLSRDKPTNGNTYVMEIIRLAREISLLFGEDVDKIGEVREEELKVESWVGRTWKFDNIVFRLTCINGYVQLYIDIDENSPARPRL